MNTSLSHSLAQNLEPLIMKKVAKSGPVITISREYGCQANALAQALQDILYQKAPNWRYLSKENLQSAAEELLEQSEKTGALSPPDENTLKQLLGSLSNPYDPGNARYHRRVKDIVASFAKEGWSIIVGRCGAALSQENPKALHIKLVAPLEWRAQSMSERRNIDPDNAKALAYGLDHQRERYITQIQGSKAHISDYDLILNRKTLSEEQMIALVLKAAELKGLF